MVNKDGYKKFFDLNAIIREALTCVPKFDKKLFLKAFNFAEKAHKGQFRKDGKTPYIVHPMAAVQILISLHAEQDVLIAALLHDVPEDTVYEIKDVEKLFGKEVAFLVDGITKLSKVQYQHNMPERDVESLKKMFLHTAKDPRVILIKLADRLHNMRTLQHIIKPEKKVRIATETLEIFVPIANLLGINILKTELEDLCFKHLFPTEYEKLKTKVKDGNARNEDSMNAFIDSLKNAFLKAKISVEISPREKGLYRAYKRLCSIGRTIDDIRDRISIKVLVKTPEKCYQAMGVVHRLFTPKPHSFEDYIANPKMNGYQSLHTIVFGPHGIETEIQLQTKEMNIESEYGITSAFFNNKPLMIDSQKTSWLMNVMAMEKDQKTGFDFLADLKIDILQDRIFVFTPKGKTVDLPKGATVIDFAYAIHSDVGEHAIKADINGEIVPIITMLRTGDVVNVITEKSASPELSWLSFVKTNVSKNKILAHLKKVSKQTKLEKGKNLVQKEFDIAGMGYLHDIPFKKTRQAILEAFNQDFSSIHDLYIAVGGGEFRSVNILKALKNSYNKFNSVLDNKKKEGIHVEIHITAKNRFGLLKDISSVFYKHVLDMLVLKAWTKNHSEIAHFKICALVSSLEDVSRIFEELEQSDDVYSVYRSSRKGFLLLLAFSFIALIAWMIHPFILQNLLASHYVQYPFLVDISLFIGLTGLIMMLILMHSILNRYFPLARNQKKLWVFAAVASVTAIILIFFELEALHYKFSKILSLIIGLTILLYFGKSYFKIRRNK